MIVTQRVLDSWKNKINNRREDDCMSLGQLTHGNYEVLYHASDSPHGFGSVKVNDLNTGCHIVNNKKLINGSFSQVFNLASGKLSLQQCQQGTYQPCDKCRENGKTFTLSSQPQNNIFDKTLPPRPGISLNMIKAISKNYELSKSETLEIFYCLEHGADTDTILNQLVEEFDWDKEEERIQDLLDSTLLMLDLLRVDAGDKWAKAHNIQPKYKVGEKLTDLIDRELFIRRVHSKAVYCGTEYIEACSYDIEYTDSPGLGYRYTYEELESQTNPDAPHPTIIIKYLPNFEYPNFFNQAKAWNKTI